MELCYSLDYSTQSYAWGKKGSQSRVLKLAVASGMIDKFDENKPYAELWLGTHKNGPSKISNSSVGVSSLDELMRLKGLEKLPYLFKVLSVNDVLSIQAHPNKACAEKLFQQFPHVYNDSNHKPEVAIAVSKFTAMCGFRPLQDVQEFLKHNPALQQIVGSELATCLSGFSTGIMNPTEATDMYKRCFEYMSKLDEDSISAAIETHREHCSKISLEENLTNNTLLNEAGLAELFLIISKLYPKDFGCFCVYFLNVFVLEPGQAIFLQPNIPHAYIYGECIECMSNSDNVIRLGLTPKFKDVDTALKLVDFSPKSLADFTVEPSVIALDSIGSVLSNYAPAIEEFAVTHFNIKFDNFWEPTLHNIHLKSSSIMLVFDSTDQMTLSLQSISDKTRVQDTLISKGRAFFIAEDCSIIKIISPEPASSLDIWLAYKP